MPSLAVRAADLAERMDDPECDPAALERTYEQFRLVNAVVSGWASIYRRLVRPRLSTSRPHRLLDIGTGGADWPRELLRRARRDGLRLEVVGIDPDARAIAWASRQPAVDGLRLRAAFSGELAEEGERFDTVLSNHLLHHLSGRELGALLADSERLAGPGGLVVHADIARSRIAYASFAAGTLPFGATLLAGSFIREDGLTSIRRSHTAAELARIAPAGWSVRPAMPCRLELIRPPTAGDHA